MVLRVVLKYGPEGERVIRHISRASRPGTLSPDQLSEDTLVKVRALNEIAAGRGQTLAQMSLAWTLRDPRMTSTLVGASSVAQLEANVGATTEANFFVGFSGDIGEGGVFIATYATFPIGTQVEVLVTLPGGYESTFPGHVRFVRDPMDMESEPGVGVRFEKLTSEQRDLVLRFIRKRPPLFYDE